MFALCIIIATVGLAIALPIGRRVSNAVDAYHARRMARLPDNYR